MKFGYSGRVLHAYLSNGELEIEHPDTEFYRKYMGGSALGAYYLLKNSPAGVDPLSPSNTLVFSLSVLTGAPISGQSRMTTTAKSPLTNAIGDAQSGGFFPAEMKFSGFDAVVFHGRSEKPVYLWLHDGEAELRPAHHLWGMFTGESEAVIRKELGDDRIEVAQCGPAGEKYVLFASIINMCNRANGRTGMGAVMGSKNLKAIAVRGTNKPLIADEKRLNKLARWGVEHFEESNIYTLGTLGTGGIVDSQNKAGGLPTHNWRSGTFEGWKSLDGKTMEKTILKSRDTCYACTVRCKRVVEVDEGPFLVDPLYGGPEYETLAALGSYCGVDDLAAVSYANQLCNMYGMDTISCGATIAWAMDCFEQGLLNTEDTGGFEIRFGDSSALVKTVELIGEREGFGDILAEGSARAAQRLGKGTSDFVVAVKNQEYPAHMPQVKRSMALIYAVNPFGADHISAAMDPDYAAFPERMAKLGLTNPQPSQSLDIEKVRFALTTQYLNSCMDSVNVCNFVFGSAWQLYDPDQLIEAINSITGWDCTLDELLRVGERRLNMLRSFNAREGIGREADTLPKKLEQPLVGGASDGLFVTNEEIEQAKDWYYEMAGWDVTSGIPTREKLKDLNLDWLAEMLEL